MEAFSRELCTNDPVKLSLKEYWDTAHELQRTAEWIYSC